MSAEFSTSLTRADELVQLHVSASSDVGSVRQVNEDSYFATPPVFLVADGMGGHAYGDRASQTVAREFGEEFGSAATIEPTTPEDVLRVIDRANAGVQGLVTEADGPGAVAGTTLAGVALVEATDMGSEQLHWMIFNVGDSRVYGWNGRSLIQITVDHSAVQEMVSMGLITPADALIHPDRNVITRSVGSEERVEVDIWLMPARGHQVFLICSDGLTKELDDAQIAELIIAYGTDPEPEVSLADMLVQTAVERGGRDNVTVAVVESSLSPVDAPDGTEERAEA
ncbi:serine/threonine protein phosphatase PrpC [Pseudoclavibacter chungangensis]|uniref:PP2C family protein-serine/threonine phosphatase n=1 Tax=Pseudoclavibacter chungangensis TaxID=587635 RepID=UPI001791C020|nr:protein phosphatase 2C domain-containing protein [Pseudoclavibacter chungangensis]NYJ67488.1 serine/threonine protein phosphatase PrpC [Pseudoclavibacter chungangensis]